ncbi:response regulator [Pedobacter arcticus]|uniref:response regulator n=1 Tax=Pedobacter arcticus TaxID=752140 RepID=UPI0002F7064F|nr:response regulator [Pedobacter arcticus]
MEKFFWIADDDPDDRMIIKDAFEENNFADSLSFFEDGEKVINRFEKESQEVGFRYPSLLILDLNMPKVNGLELLIHLKSDRKTKKIPIVILSTSKSSQDKEKMMKLGADDFITKPFSFDSMIEITRNLIEKYG